MNEQEERYIVTVPVAVQGSNDYFNAQLGHLVYTIHRPQGSIVGSQLDIRVFHSPTAPTHFTVALLNPKYLSETHAEPHSDIMASSTPLIYLLTFQIAIGIVIFILLTLGYALPRFAVQTLSSSCLCLNPNDDSLVNSIDYNLYKGMGSNTFCNTKGNDFCLQWSYTSFWSRVDETIKSSYNRLKLKNTDHMDSVDNHSNDMMENPRMMLEAEYALPAAQVLIPLASALAAICLLNTLFLLSSLKARGFSSFFVNSSLIISAVFMALTWITSISGLISAATSSLYSPTPWTYFYKAGYPLKAVIGGSIAETLPDIVLDCDIATVLSGLTYLLNREFPALIVFVEGFIVIVVGTVLAFVSSCIFCCSQCAVSILG